MIALLLSLCTTANAIPDSLGTAEVIAQKRVTGIATSVPVQHLDSAAVFKRGITDIADALRRFSGVNLRDYGGAGGLKTVSVRGLGAAHTAVAYDGLCVNDTRQGQTDMGQFSLDLMRTIELQTLDQSQLLCPVRQLAQAVVSLNAAPQTLPTNYGIHGALALQQASWGTWNPQVDVGGRIGRNAYVNAAGRYFFAHNNYPFTIENGSATTHTHRNNSRMQSTTTELNWLQRLGGGMLSSKAYFYHNYRHLPGMVHYYVNQNNERLLEQTAFAQSRWQRQGPRWQTFVAAKYNWQVSKYHDIDGQYPDGILKQHYWQREAYATAGFRYSITDFLQVAYATDYAHASQNSNLKTDYRVSRDTWLQSLSVGLQVNRFQLTARAAWHRYWNQSVSGTSARNAQRVTPSVSTLWQAIRGEHAQWYLRCGYKESFRMPTFTESYYYHLGSTQLNPELTRQLSVGQTLQASPSQHWRTLAFTADAYAARVKDRIVSIPYNLFVWKTVNLGDVRTLGVDLTLHSLWQLTTRHTLEFNTNYSLQHCTDHTKPALSSWHKQLAYTPLHSGAASLAWMNPWASLSVHGTWSSMRWCTNNHLPTTSLPAYTEWGAAVFRSFTLCHGRTLTLRADVLNLFDHRYEVIRRYPMPGRAYKLSIKFAW